MKQCKALLGIKDLFHKRMLLQPTNLLPRFRIVTGNGNAGSIRFQPLTRHTVSEMLKQLSKLERLL